MTGPHPPVVMLMGPTASGKTAASLALAERMPVEIVSVDSAQIYRGMDIGTAKPDAEFRRRIPHHLIDILDPAEAYSAARFANDATALIEQIRGRGRVPLLVGGTMLYFRALRHGLSPLPPADPEVRARLEQLAAEQGVPALHARLQAVDPQSAARLHPNDQQRIQRALEIFELAGQTQSRLFERPKAPTVSGTVRCLALVPADRSRLHERIARRFAQMIEEGFVEEVRQLWRRGDLSATMPSMRAVGYRQIWRYLGGELPLDAAVAAGVAATRQYAKRQLTWLRAEPDVTQLDPDAPDLVRRLLAEVRPA